MQHFAGADGHRSRCAASCKTCPPVAS
jgi:hypothetical protein